MRGFRKIGGRSGRYYLCHRSKGRSVSDPPQSERLPLGDGGCCFPFASVVFKEILTAESDSLPGVDMRQAGGVEVLHSQLPWTKQSTPQLIT